MIAPAAARERPRTAMTDEDHGLAGCAASYQLGLAQAIRRPCHDSASKVGDAQIAAIAGQVSRDQIPRGATDQRAVDQQQPSSHALFVSAAPDTLAGPPTGCHNPRQGWLSLGSAL